jgi:hypothetical protein
MIGTLGAFVLTRMPKFFGRLVLTAMLTAPACDARGDHRVVAFADVRGQRADVQRLLADRRGCFPRVG